MKIKKFFESEENLSISSDTINDMVDKISSISMTFDEKKKEIESMISVLSGFKSKSDKSNTQIDDSYLNLQTVVSNIEETLELLDSVSTNIKDYYESGEKYLY